MHIRLENVDEMVSSLFEKRMKETHQNDKHVSRWDFQSWETARARPRFVRQGSVITYPSDTQGTAFLISNQPNLLEIEVH